MVVALVLLFFTLVLWIYWMIPKRPNNFPPGPFNFPLLGAAVYAESLDTAVEKSFHKLGKIYGPIVGLFLGKRRCLIVTGYEASKEIFNSPDFDSRPDLFINNFLYNDKSLGIFFSNGERWKEQRRFTLRHLRDLGFGKSSLEALIHEEVEDCLANIWQHQKESRNQSVSLIHSFKISMINIIWAIIAGQRFSQDDEKFKQLILKTEQAFRAGDAGGGGIINDYPFLRHIPFLSRSFHTLINGQLCLLDYIKKEVADHMKTFSNESPPNNLMDVYLQTTEKMNNDDHYFSVEQLEAICMDFFAAGTESTSNTTSFLCLYMILYPDVQTKVQKEIDNVIGTQAPSYSDQNRLPYTAAVIAEVFRISSIGPIAPPLSNSKSCKLMGYDIPKDTMVIINLHSIHNDEEYWGDPENFRPERFLNEKGEYIKSERMLPFGMGRRNCIGEPMARITNFILFVRTMQKFRLEIPSGEPTPSKISVPGFTVSPRPFNVHLIPRNSNSA